MRQRDFPNSRRREFDADTEYRQPRAFGTRPGFNRAPVEAPSGPPVSGSSNGSVPKKGLASSNFRTDQVTLSYMGAFWPKAVSTPYSQEKPSKCGSAPATRGRMSPRC